MPTTALASTGTTSVTPSPDDELARPKAGTYGFRETITAGNNKPSARDTFTTLRVTDRVVRVQETDSVGAAKTEAFYDERHDADGLWLVTSAVGDGTCTWTPKSAALPTKAIEGGSVSTTSTCKTPEANLRLETTIAFKTVRNVTVAGRTLRCIDVTRRRELKDPTATITSEAVDTYAFELGMRIATAERTTTATPTGSTSHTRNLVLVSLPS